MNRTKMQWPNGRVQMMEERFAVILEKIGKAKRVVKHVEPEPEPEEQPKRRGRPPKVKDDD